MIPILACGLVVGCEDAPAPAGGAAGTEVAESAASAERNVVYVDVRTPEEYEAGHVEGAINIPHTEMDARHDELAEYADREIVVYCRSGRRSGIAERILESEGFANVTNGGGLSDLARQGVPTTR
ncbi:MAG: rhodanese-like domain-containing protein [Gemmatimonadota bacterium]